MAAIKEERIKVGNRLREIRAYFNLRQNDMVRDVSFGRGNYSRIEKGEVMVGLEMMHMLYQKYNISLDWLLTGKGNMFRSKSDDINISDIGDSSVLLDLVNDIKDIPLIRFAVFEFYARYKMEHIHLLHDNDEDKKR